MAAATNYLPQEIIFIVLSWLPVLSLLRFKKVCKSWYSIISSPDFIRAHLANSHKRQPYLLRSARIIGMGEMYIDSAEGSIKLDLPQHANNMYLRSRSCNGLICVANNEGNVIHLFNPATKWCKRLPTPTIKSCGLWDSLGFGFDSVGNDHKLLRIMNKRGGNTGFDAEVYSANANSWKPINAPDQLPGKRFFTYNTATCVQDKNGILYMEGAGNRLLSFNLHSEVLGIYLYPQPSHHVHRANILDFEGSVALIYYKPFDVQSAHSLWTLDNICGELSWTKKFNFQMSREINWLHLYTGFEKFLAFNLEEGFVFYDYRKRKSKRISISARVSQVGSVSKYTDTLIALN